MHPDAALVQYMASEAVISNITAEKLLRLIAVDLAGKF